MMKTLLVISPHPEIAETIRVALGSTEYRVIHRVNSEDAEPFIVHSLAQACIVDVELTGVQGIWMIERLRKHNAKCPFIVYTGEKQSEWEEEAYLRGVNHVLTKPVRPRVLETVLHRIFAVPSVASSSPPFAPRTEAVSDLSSAATVSPGTAQTISVLKNFSSILSHSLDSDALLRQFLIQLREIVSINRAVIFLRPAEGVFGNAASPEESRRLRAACSIGVPQGLLDQCALSLESGLGAQLQRLGRILRRNSDEARSSADTQREFELLGGQVAVPIMDRESLIGVAVFDGRITGEALVNAELELIYHLLEHLALAIRNIWLHGQLAANNDMMTGVLRELSSACVVVGNDLKILHANKMSRKYFGSSRSGGEMEFSDLPEVIAAKVYQVLRTGAAVTPFRYEPEGANPGVIYGVSAIPFQQQNGRPASALLTVEDLTQSEQMKRLELEATNLRLIKSMADRLAHEVGNAMVPLSTHQQLLAEKYRDAEFRASLDAALADGVKRVTRLINQMRFLARDSITTQEHFAVSPLIEEAFQEARKYQPAKAAQLKYDNGGAPAFVTGDRAALKYALTEVLINALQANPTEPKVGVRLDAEGNGSSPGGLQIEVQDNGGGFTAEAMQKASAPFFTTRNVGLGLGLTVCRKIIETHHGKLEIVAPKTGHSGIVRISLPLDSVQKN
ncbi:MAG: response regulator [Verrucomicrobia bacterium]|nr:response regulator [Verrucomicrobiota bacterium]